MRSRSIQLKETPLYILYEAVPVPDCHAPVDVEHHLGER